MEPNDTSRVSADELARAYRNIRDKREELSKEYDTKDSKLVQQLDIVNKRILDLCRDIDADSIKTSSGTITRSIKIRYIPTNWEAVYKFIDKHKDHDLAGSAQYWYGETFRIRQLYSDAATAYLDGYQNYPKCRKAADNLLKLGITMVQLGEKDQGCKMINGVEKQYPKANQSVIQKAKYESQKFECNQNS